MKGYVTNIEKTTKDNKNFRTVLYTAKNTQLVVMNIKSGEEGKAKAVFNNGETEYDLEDDWAIVIPAGTWHNIINTGDGDLKLYTLYSPPEHKDGTVHRTREEAMAHEEHFDGGTTE